MRRMFVPRLAACSVAWNTETLELESADGRTQVVDILWRDALEAVQQHFLTTRYDMGELQFEPRIADRLADQVFDDYCRKKRWSEFFWGNGRGRCAVDLRKECAVSRIACIYVGAWAVCSSVGSSRAGVTVVSRAHTTACPHATAGRRPENCII